MFQRSVVYYSYQYVSHFMLEYTYGISLIRLRAHGLFLSGSSINLVAYRFSGVQGYKKCNLKRNVCEEEHGMRKKHAYYFDNDTTKLRDFYLFHYHPPKSLI